MKSFYRFCSCCVINFILFLSGCQQATNDNTQYSGSVNGTLNGQSFSTVNAVATVGYETTDSYRIVLSGSTSTPNITFSVDSSPKTYTVTTFGINGLSVISYIGGNNFVSFDSGTLKITSIDTSAKTITGAFTGLKTSDGTCSLGGTFTAIIQ